MDAVAIGQSTAYRAQQYSQTAFLQNIHIVIVGVTHCPAGRMAFRFFTIDGIHETTMAISPFEVIVKVTVFDFRHHRIVYVPIDGHFAALRLCGMMSVWNW